MTHPTREVFMAFTFSFGLMLVMGTAVQAEAEDMQKVSPAMKEEGPSTDSGEIQERAVPRMGMPGMAAPKAGVQPNAKGLTIQGNRLKAISGYVLKKGPKNQVSARRASGSLGGTATCQCTKTGNCEMSSQGDTAICSKDPGKPCHGSCEWELGVMGRAGSAGKVFKP